VNTRGIIVNFEKYRFPATITLYYHNSMPLPISGININENLNTNIGTSIIKTTLKNS
jgi:hypothetical protein